MAPTEPEADAGTDGRVDGPVEHGAFGNSAEAVAAVDESVDESVAPAGAQATVQEVNDHHENTTNTVAAAPNTLASENAEYVNVTSGLEAPAAETETGTETATGPDVVQATPAAPAVQTADLGHDAVQKGPHGLEINTDSPYVSAEENMSEKAISPIAATAPSGPPGAGTESLEQSATSPDVAGPREVGEVTSPGPELTEKAETAKSPETAKKTAPTATAAAPTAAPDADGLQITLLLISGLRSLLTINSDYLATHSSKTHDPPKLSVREFRTSLFNAWQEDWGTTPSSISNIRLIHLGKVLEDSQTLEDCGLVPTNSVNIVHLSVKPQSFELDSGEDSKAGRRRRRDSTSSNDRSCCCTIS